MSEKRFTLMENISAYDGRVISEYVLDNEKRLTFEEVVDLLNSLVDENEQLQQERDYWKDKAMTLLMQIRRLTSRMTDEEVKEFSKELEECVSE